MADHVIRTRCENFPRGVPLAQVGEMLPGALQACEGLYNSTLTCKKPLTEFTTGYYFSTCLFVARPRRRFAAICLAEHNATTLHETTDNTGYAYDINLSRNIPCAKVVTDSTMQEEALQLDS
ncbi:hypothetical protein Bbelb_393550 [Branchiostoma belcheri]|nr:hypothetical protein Bbelb_393550 [Branchiostoma belcheri]